MEIVTLPLSLSHNTLELTTPNAGRNGQCIKNGQSEAIQISPIDGSRSKTAKQPSLNLLRQSKVTTLFRTQKISQKSSNEMDKKLLLLFILDFQPFSMVEDNGFKAFVTALNPAYQLPSRHSISKTCIQALYEECLHKVKDIVKQGVKFCITTDCWTSRNTVSYIAVTVHFLNDNFDLYTILLECRSMDTSHTSENLALELKDIVENWGIQDKILLAVSDNAVNIKNAIKIKLNYPYFGCFAHTINLIVKDGLKNVEVSNIINKVRHIVTHFKRSTTSHNKLMVYQSNAGSTPLKLIKDVDTRWNSTFYMLERFLLLEDAIKATMALINKELSSISQREWLIIKKLCIILKPFEDATKNICGESYCSASLVIPMANGLINVYSNLKASEYPSELFLVISKLEAGLKSRLGDVDKNDTLAICTFLDPRFKNLAFCDSDRPAHIKDIVTTLVSERYSYQKHQTIQEEDITEGGSPKELSIWRSFDTYVSHNKPRGTSLSHAIIEVQRYLEDDIIPRKENPLQWWRTHKFKYPQLSIIAVEKLCALASSVPCERVFSKAGQVLNERRSRLSDKKTKMLLFLNANYKYVQ